MNSAEPVPIYREPVQVIREPGEVRPDNYFITNLIIIRLFFN
jgi:hypothetical protein